MNPDMGLSKREQKKIQQAVKLIEATQLPHCKPRKKRKLSSHISINHSHHDHAAHEEQDNIHETKSTQQLTPLRDKTKEEEQPKQQQQQEQEPPEQTDMNTDRTHREQSTINEQY